MGSTGHNSPDAFLESSAASLQRLGKSGDSNHFKNPSSHAKIRCIIDCFVFTSISSRAETSWAGSAFIITICFESEVEAVATSLASSSGPPACHVLVGIRLAEELLRHHARKVGVGADDVVGGHRRTVGYGFRQPIETLSDVPISLVRFFLS